eukprot:6462445-Pyramimonas_sp.AAC.1
MRSRRTWSKAPMPSMLTMVAAGSESVAARRKWAALSVPALVESAYWNGAQASSISDPYCRERALPTSRRKASPATMPRARP